MLVSIVIPCYNSEHSIKKTVELTVEEFKKLPGYECECHAPGNSSYPVHTLH